jgi:hypothetical protein
MTAGYPQSAPVRTSEEFDALDRIDSRVRSIAAALGAHEMRYPALIARGVLDRAEYPQAFPHLLMSACRSTVLDNGDIGQWCLSPAVCYHTYAQLAGRVLEAPAVITARGRCFRAERNSAPGVRQIEFEMREIVVLGRAAWVDASAEAAKLAIETIAGDLRLSGQWLAAEDPFFLPAAAGKALMQRLLKVKVEYQWPGPGGLALASVNRHGSFFGERFDIATADGQPIHTACIAVGLDRWAHHAQESAANRYQEVRR